MSVCGQGVSNNIGEVIISFDNYADKKTLHHKAGVFMTLLFRAMILYINEELLEDFIFSACYFSLCP